MKELARYIFSSSGAGYLIVQLMFIAVASYLGGWIAKATGKGQIAQMINVASILIGILLVAETAVSTLTRVMKVFGY